MAQNLMLDPMKRDYVTKDGSPVPTDRILEATYYALSIPQGKWLYGDSSQGSLIHTLLNKKRIPALEQLFSDYASRAVRTQLIDTGQATDVVVQNVQSTRTGTLNKVSVVPAQQALSDQLSFVSV